jgi:hypothetical protein
LVGKYTSTTNPNCFLFKSDSTFLNEYREGHAVKYSKGSWKRQSQNIILLNTEIKNTNIPMKVTASNGGIANEIQIKVNLTIKNGLNLSNYYCYVYGNNQIQKKIRCDSLLNIKLRPSIDELHFVFIKNSSPPIIYTFPLTTAKARLDHFSNNIIIDIDIEDLYFNYHPFDNEIIRQKPKGIEIFNSYLNKWQTIPKVSNKTNIFIHFNE